MSEELEKLKKKLVKPVVFMGLMGAGKTETGKAFAQVVGRKFTDSDDLIVAQEGLTIPEIFEKHDEAYFRQVEQQVIAQALQEPDIVLSIGGGAIMNAETAGLIATHAYSVFLDADVHTLVTRTAADTNRPLLKNGDPAAILADLKEKRYPAYAKADITVDGNGTIEQVLEGVITGLNTYLSS